MCFSHFSFASHILASQIQITCAQVIISTLASIPLVHQSIWHRWIERSYLEERRNCPEPEYQVPNDILRTSGWFHAGYIVGLLKASGLCSCAAIIRHICGIAYNQSATMQKEKWKYWQHASVAIECSWLGRTRNDSTTETSVLVFGLQTLFTHARIVHVLVYISAACESLFIVLDGTIQPISIISGKRRYIYICTQLIIITS